MKSDINIAQSAQLLPISEIASRLGIKEDEVELYGKYKAKITDDFINRNAGKPDGKLILVTAISPTPAGEGKTTTTVGLGQAMARIGKKAIIALREPSLGPVFGVKGGAAGGGYSQVLPMEDINLHFTGDFHAITAANNLLCAIIDNHIQQGNELNIDQRRIFFNRVTDTNDRALRNIIIGLGTKADGIPREDHFTITVASEVMAILCLAKSISDLKKRLGDIFVAYTVSGDPVFARDLNIQGSMAALLRDALKPNLVQTLENTPALIHGGPFANIAHGCNSVRATKLALKLADYTITEAGFGADLGAEKFFDIKCRMAEIKPSAVVLVTTIRALKYHGGISKDNLKKENCGALRKGACNLEAHLANIAQFGVPAVVALNRFETDTEREIDLVRDICAEAGVEMAVSELYAKGGEGGLDLAEKVVKACDIKNDFHFLYPDEMSLEEKIETIAVKIYGASGVKYDDTAESALKSIKAIDPAYSAYPVCMAKTQYSLSDNPALIGRPSDYYLNIRDVHLSAGARFIVVLTGAVMTMPGLPKKPAAYKIDIDDDGNISGLF